MVQHPPGLDDARPEVRRTTGRPGARPPGAPAGRPVPPRPRAPRPDEDAVRTRRAVTLLLLTLVAPGAAQVAAGNRRLGLIALRTWAGVIGTLVFGALLWVLWRGAVLAVLTLPTMLALIGGLLVLGGILWPLLVADAWRLGRNPPPPVPASRWIALLTVVLVLVTCVPVVGAGRRVWAASDLIGSVFGSGAGSEAAHGRYNVLLLGGDAGASRIGLRPDSVTLASIDADTGRTVLLSLPRNLENVPFPHGSRAEKALPDGWSCGDECLLNAVYQYGTQHADQFPGVEDPGAEAMKQAVSATLGLQVNYYVLVDLKGFSSLIDAVGGVKLNVARRVPIGGGTSRVYGYIEPGRNKTLDGHEALWFARSRHGSSDYERMQRQRCVMDAMLQQLEPTTVLTRFQKIAAAGKQVVSTDIPAGELDTFIQLAANAKGQKVTSVQFVPPLITPARPDLGVIRARTAKAIEAAEKPPAPKPSASASAAPAGGGTAKPAAAPEAADDVRAACSVA